MTTHLTPYTPTTIMRIYIGVFVCLSVLLLPELAFSQEKDPKWDKEGALEDVTIDIVKRREITLPKANRNFEKIPPRPAENNRAPISYDFRAFSFQTPQINPLIRPLKLKTGEQSEIFGNYVSVGYGNYASPYLEAFVNSSKDKKKLLGAHAILNSSDKGPVDGSNSGGGIAGISLYGQTFSESLALSGNVGFESRATHFYGYVPGTGPESAKDIKQSFGLFKIGGSVANARNADFVYKLDAGFSYLADKFDARESEVDLVLGSAYRINEDSRIKIDASYAMISRKDIAVDGKSRSLFTVNPAYAFMPVDNLRLSIGFVTAVENDTIDNKDVHVYPDIHATYPLSPSVNFVGSLTGGIEKVSLQSLTNENMWLAPNVDIFHTNKAFDLTVALHGKLGNKVALDGGLSMASLKNWYFYENSKTDQAKFIVTYDKGSTKRSNFFASLSYAEANIAKFIVRGDYYAYTTGDIAEAWHRPTYKLTVDASYNVYQKILLSASLIAQGGMKAKDPITDATVKLDNAFDLNFKAEYLFSRSFSFFAQLNNITSNKYPVFLNYPVRGFQVLGGITWRF